jgi:hypothetical protein
MLMNIFLFLKNNKIFLFLQIFDPLKIRYEPPLPLRVNSKPLKNKISHAQYKLEIDENVPGFKVIRSKNNQIL